MSHEVPRLRHQRVREANTPLAPQPRSSLVPATVVSAAILDAAATVWPQAGGSFISWMPPQSVLAPAVLGSLAMLYSATQKRITVRPIAIAVGLAVALLPYYKTPFTAFIDQFMVRL